MRKTLTPSASRRGFVSGRRPASAGRVRPLVGLWLAAAVLNLCATDALASAAKAAGELTVVGAVAVDGTPAASGLTFFSGSTVATGPSARATLGVGRLGRLELAPEGSLRLDFSAAHVAGSLGAGLVRVSAPAGLPAEVRTADASVIAAGGEAALFSVRFEGGATTVSVQAGRVELRAAGRARSVAAGETLSSAGGAAPAPSPGEGRRLGLGLGLAAAIAILIIAITGRGDEVRPDECHEGQLLVFSPGSFTPCE